MERYFAYGSNMRSLRLRERVPEARPIGRCRLPGHLLVCNKPGRDGSGKANLVAHPRVDAWGVLWEVERGVWPTLDRYEPGYERAHCEVVLDGGATARAAVYLYRAPAQRRVPQAWYREHLVLGALEFGLPPDWVARIRAL